jgi:hypothetical protein
MDRVPGKLWLPRFSQTPVYKYGATMSDNMLVTEHAPENRSVFSITHLLHRKLMNMYQIPTQFPDSGQQPAVSIQRVEALVPDQLTYQFFLNSQLAPWRSIRLFVPYGRYNPLFMCHTLISHSDEAIIKDRFSNYIS